MEMIIRRASIDDIQDINALLRLSKGYWGYSEAFLDRFMAGFSLTSQYVQKYDVKLVYDQQMMMGFFNFIINKDQALELDNFFLHPDYIGQGVGRKLWNGCCQLASQLGRAEFVIWSDPNAELFYLKMGCEKIGVRASPTMPNRYPPVLRFRSKKL